MGSNRREVLSRFIRKRCKIHTGTTEKNKNVSQKEVSDFDKARGETGGGEVLHHQNRQT